MQLTYFLGAKALVPNRSSTVEEFGLSAEPIGLVRDKEFVLGLCWFSVGV